jgi:hypothetical protein
MKQPECPKCGETLSYHAGRGKYFHEWAFGPYDGTSSGECVLDGMAFEQDGTPIVESDVRRKMMVEAIHGHKPKTLEDSSKEFLG